VNSSTANSTNRPIVNDERNQLENEEITTSTQNPLSDERMQQCKSFLRKQ
jgi:hypothetical protein